MAELSVRVPDIGGHSQVPVIEVLVKPGDRVGKDQGLVVLESDKATMEVPSPMAGVVRAVLLKVGDRVDTGALVATLEPAEGADTSQPQAAATAVAPAAAIAAPSEPAHEGQLLVVPDIGDYRDVPVIEVLIKAGDEVARDQGIAVLESDKATMEVPAGAPGTVAEVLVRVGDRVSAGTPVARLAAAGGAGTAAIPPAATAPAAAAPAAAPAPPVAAVSVGTAAPASLAPLSAAPDPAASGASVPHASPGVRLFARELGVDLARVRGSGRKGRITREDVQAFVKAELARPAQPAPVAAAGTGAGFDLLPWPEVDFTRFGEVERQPLSRIKKISGANLARNWVRIPHVTQFDEADITEMEAFRKATQEQLKEVKLTPLVFLIKASVAALKRFPRVNASLDGDTLVLKRYFHIGIAVDTPDGLVVPVLRDCDRKGLVELATELAAISAKARDKKLGPADMQGGCFSISSLGGIGGTGFTPIINAPEVAILGVSKSSLRPVWDGKSFVPRLMLPLSFSYDHRVIDGAEAARFTAFLAQQLSDVRRLLL